VSSSESVSLESVKYLLFSSSSVKPSPSESSTVITGSSGGSGVSGSSEITIRLSPTS